MSAQLLLAGRDAPFRRPGDSAGATNGEGEPKGTDDDCDGQLLTLSDTIEYRSLSVTVNPSASTDIAYSQVRVTNISNLSASSLYGTQAGDILSVETSRTENVLTSSRLVTGSVLPRQLNGAKPVKPSLWE